MGGWVGGRVGEEEKRVEDSVEILSIGCGVLLFNPSRLTRLFILPKQVEKSKKIARSPNLARDKAGTLSTDGR